MDDMDQHLERLAQAFEGMHDLLDATFAPTRRMEYGELEVGMNEALMRLSGSVEIHAHVQHRMSRRHQQAGYVDSENASGISPHDQRSDERSNHTLHACDREVEQNMDYLLQCLQNRPENPFPFTAREPLAKKLIEIGGIMTDMGMLLPEDFYPKVNAAVRKQDGLAK